jgi:hypothetical protein
MKSDSIVKESNVGGFVVKVNVEVKAPHSYYATEPDTLSYQSEA